MLASLAHILPALLCFQFIHYAVAFSLPFTPSYAPKKVSCPSTPLVRAASGLSSGESDYVKARKPKADAALAQWLEKTNDAFPTSNLPILGLATSGGGYRALLTGAGIVQALDSRDSNVGTSGLFQALTYQAGLSGGAWLLSSLAGNDYPTISDLKTNLWEKAFQDGLINLGHLPGLIFDLYAKDKAGFPPTIVDVWGRFLSYQLIKGGGAGVRLSDVTSRSNFAAHEVGYPIMTAIGVHVTKGECMPPADGTQYEFHPYESGSWDQGVSAFTPTAFLGTSLRNGNPVKAGQCINNFDNLGYVFGTSSSLFNEACLPSPPGLAGELSSFLNKIHSVAFEDEFGVYPNPFFQRPESSAVSSEDKLFLVDGGETQQVNPIWPFIQPARNIDVLIVNDNTADTSSNFPNGTQILNTYKQAQAAGLKKMPLIPSADVFIANGFQKRPTFFGCDSLETLTIVYLPNTAYSFASGESTDKLEYSEADTDGMIANGGKVATENGDANWPTCLGCAITKKIGGSLPDACSACFKLYCYQQ